jgi:hypothetical protein
MTLSNILFLLIVGGVLAISAVAILLHGRASIRRTQWAHVFVLGLCGAGMLTLAVQGNDRLREPGNMAIEMKAAPARLAARP